MSIRSWGITSSFCRGLLSIAKRCGSRSPRNVMAVAGSVPPIDGRLRELPLPRCWHRPIPRGDRTRFVRKRRSAIDRRLVGTGQGCP